MSCSVSPTGKVVLAGVTAIETNVGGGIIAGVTVSRFEPATEFKVAVTKAIPDDVAMARPELLNETTPKGDEPQATELLTSRVLPSL